MEYFVLVINATALACEKFITVAFHNSDYSYYSCSMSLFVDVCEGGGYSVPVICN